MIRVLLADDQELFRAGLRIILDSQADIEVVDEASDGSEAVAKADALSPDVVLMDLQMPGTDGVEATRQLFTPARVDRRDRPLAVLVLTTFNLDNRAATAIRHGASGFLLKTCTPAQLHDAVRAVHAGNAVVSPRDLIQLIDTEFSQPRAVPPQMSRLTQKERTVFDAIARGLSNTEIADEIYASESTVKTHVGAVLRKLGLRDRVQVVVFAHDHGLR